MAVLPYLLRRPHADRLPIRLATAVHAADATLPAGRPRAPIPQFATNHSRRLMDFPALSWPYALPGNSNPPATSGISRGSGPSTRSGPQRSVARHGRGLAQQGSNECCARCPINRAGSRGVARDCPSIPDRAPRPSPQIVHRSPGPVSIFVRSLQPGTGRGTAARPGSSASAPSAAHGRPPSECGHPTA